ncbi:MAG: tRNA (adenosine(37)-N6)-threonylcarbamoyltransferase complex ATPase subunit type 1 TsaE [Pseudomonadota bacterium]
MMSARHPIEIADFGTSMVASSEAETEALGKKIATGLAPGDLVLLDGQLGAGKSVFCRSAVRTLMQTPDLQVASPSYTVVNVYSAPTFDIWHVDLYRLGDPEELLELGIEDAAQSTVMLVEWGQRWQSPPARRLEIGIAIKEPNARQITFHAHGGDWRAVALAMDCGT